MKIGYARVSREDQNLDLQHDALKAAGCDEIFDDKMTGARMKRPGLDQTLARLAPGDELIVGVGTRAVPNRTLRPNGW